MNTVRSVRSDLLFEKHGVGVPPLHRGLRAEPHALPVPAPKYGIVLACERLRRRRVQIESGEESAAVVDVLDQLSALRPD